MIHSIESPTVSVIVPNYNHAQYLRQRIQSILNQTFQDFDLIYLDDASSDNSNAVFKEFETDPRIKAIYNDKNSGSPFKQWNKGVRATTGKYIWIAESDDVADPNFLSTLVSLLDRYPNVGLAYCQSCRIDSNGVMLTQTLNRWLEDLSPNRWNQDFIVSGIIECQKYLLFKNTIPNASAVLIRRSIYELIGGAEEALFLSGDWMTWIRILLNSDLAFHAQSLNSFRTHQSSVRAKSTLDNTEFNEYLSIQQTIMDSIDVPTETLLMLNEQLAGKLALKWIYETVNGEIRFNQGNFIKLYQKIKESTPRPEPIIARQLIWYMNFQIVEQIKRWIPKSMIDTFISSKK